MAGLGVNESLTPGQERRSDSGNARFVLQGDGNLVLYVRRPSGEVARWASNTVGKGTARCVMQGDGNLVLYNPAGKPLWDSKTAGKPGATLTVQDDENVVVYAPGGKAVWSTDTWVAGWVDSTFKNTVSGLRFSNSFPNANIAGIHLTGLCGGMTFTTLDYHYAGRPAPRLNTPPSTEATKLGGYIKARHVQSLINVSAAASPATVLGVLDVVGLVFGIPPPDLGGGIAHLAANVPNYNLQQFLALQNASDAALREHSIAEFNKVRASIDAGRPVPIGLIARGGGLTDAHQMAAVGYRDGKKDKWLRVWDQNSPESGVQEIWISHDHDLHQTADGFAWRGFFAEQYAPESPPLTGADEAALTDRRAFDAALYLQIYDDLAAAFHGDHGKASAHWLSYGTREGRRASTQLDPAYYLGANGDLKAAFGVDNYESAVQHWITNGIGEGRRSSDEFDVAWYLANHADLVAAFGARNYGAAADHWLTHGLGEGRQSSATFNVGYYLGSYPDLVKAFGARNYAAAFQHWLHYGKKEGRKATP